MCPEISNKRLRDAYVQRGMLSCGDCPSHGTVIVSKQQSSSSSNQYWIVQPSPVECGLQFMDTKHGTYIFKRSLIGALNRIGMLKSCDVMLSLAHRPVGRFRSAIAKGRYRKGPLSQKSAGHMQNHKTTTNTNPSPDPNRYRMRCPDPNARIQKFIHYMAIATFAIADLCDSGPLQQRTVTDWPGWPACTTQQASHSGSAQSSIVHSVTVCDS